MPDPSDHAAADLLGPAVRRIDVLVDDPAAFDKSDLRALRRLIVTRQDMLRQGLHREDAGIEGTRARYNDDVGVG